MSSRRNQSCPCGSGKKYKKCCGSRRGVQAAEVVRQQGQGTANLSYASSLMQQGRLDEARKTLLSVLQAGPEDVRAIVMLAGIAYQSGDYPAAIEHLDKAIAINPADANLHRNLGGVYKLQSDFVRACASFNKAIELIPNDIYSMMQVVECYARQGKFEEAIDYCKRAIRLDPKQQDVHCALGSLYVSCHRIDEAIDVYRAVNAVDPDSEKANVGLGDCLRIRGEFNEAVQYYDRALSNPGSVDRALIHSNIGVCRQACGYIGDALEAFRRAIELQPAKYELRTNLLMAYNYSNEHEPEEVFRQHALFDEFYAARYKNEWVPYQNSCNPDRKLKIGYVSSNFYQHSVANFIKPVLECHDRGRFEVFAYHNNIVSDAITDIIKPLISCWREVAHLSDHDLTQLIRDDGIDILVDLNGHTSDNRLMVFARKPAPVQVTWIGYPNTTGMSAMDYRITDSVADPPGETERYHAERLIRLPDVFSCFAPSDTCPDVVAPPAKENGFITFGSFNNFSKITPQMLAIWCELMNNTPDSRIILKSELFRDDRMRERVAGIFNQAGIDQARVDLLGKDVSRMTHLERYGGMDIALDSFPYNGTTTTCEALWMGVPVVTLAGSVHAGRVTASQLMSIGLKELIAHSPREYVDVACSLARDLDYLRELRFTMRDRMLSSPLMNARALTENLEQAYRNIWQEWCKGR